MEMCFDELIEYSPYELNRADKQRVFLERMNALTDFHYNNCAEYKRICDCIYDGKITSSLLEEVPLIPVSLFKTLKLRSVAEDKIVKTMTSSGTTGQQVSKIYLDRETSANQQKVLAKIVSDFTGSSRMPMIILDSP